MVRLIDSLLSLDKKKTLSLSLEMLFSFKIIFLLKKVFSGTDSKPTPIDDFEDEDPVDVEPVEVRGLKRNLPLDLIF